MTTFNWLHLTDLHYGQKEQVHLWSQAREMFFDDLKKKHECCGPFDAVFFTGDLVFSGDKKQFEGFENEVLVRLYETLGTLQTTPPVLLAVPGNHDLKRYSKQLAAPVRVITSNEFESNPDGFWDTKKNQYRTSVEKALKNYRDWWEKTLYRGSQPITAGIFTGDFATTLQAGEFKIGVVGLNSTTRQLIGGDFEGKLLLHSKQLHHACGGEIEDWLKNHHISLLLTHQGPQCLTESCRTEEYDRSIYPSGRFAVHLFGHMHKLDYTETSQAGAKSRRYYQSASWFGMDDYGEPPKPERKHGYAMGRLEFSNGQINLRFWPREGTVGGENNYSFKRDSQATLQEDDGGTEPTPVGSYEQIPVSALPIEIPNEVVLPAIFPFLLENIKNAKVSIINPYKNLGFYDVGDVKCFFGRDGYTDLVVDALVEGFEKLAKSPIVRISGPSGTGKSSLLRAGVIAKLKQQRAEDIYIVFRPTDFHDSNGVPADIIKKLLLFIDSQTELRINSSTMEQVVASPRSVGKAVELIENLLKQKSPEKPGHLVIGFDQFEEVVDDLCNKQFAKYWVDLKDFIDQAVNSKHIGLLLTLESSREQNFKCCGLSEKIVKCVYVQLDGFNEEFLRDIVISPFRKACYPLSNEVADKLMENANELKTKRGDSNENSLLPLLALKLYHLFDKVVAIKGSPVGIDNDIQKSFGRTGDEGITLKELNSKNENLEISSEIENLANAAWFRATGKKEVNPEQLGYFLKPLVRLANPNSDNLVLCTIGIPPYENELRLAEEFRAFRLLVPVDNDRGKPRLRLVHEAVIRFWPPAATWLNEQAEFLKKEAVIRLNSDRWFANGQPDRIYFPSNKQKQKEIDSAAEILSTYLRTWSFANSDGLEKADKQLLDYCLKMFNLSVTPLRLILNSKYDSLHVHLAAYYGQTALLEKFKQLDSKCLDVPRKDGRTPLYCASWAQKEAVRFLLENHCNATHADNDDWPPIASAIMMDRRDIFDLLLPYHDKESFFVSKTKRSTLLHYCAQCGRLNMAKEFAEKNKISPNSLDENGWLPLHRAAFGGHHDLFAYLAERSEVTHATNKGWTALHLAAQGGHYPIVNSLLKNPAFRGFEEARTDSGDTALMIAALNHRSSILSLLLEDSNPNLTNRSGSAALHLAIQSYSALTEQRCLEIVQLLLADQRTDLNKKNAEGTTPLGVAKDKPNLLKVLLQDSRIDPDLPCSEIQDDTPLLLSAKAKNWAVFEQLLQRSKRDCSLPIDDKKNTLLHVLAKSNAPFHIIEKLLNTPNLDINVLNQRGYTPLMTAIAENAWELTRRMLTSDKIDLAIYGDKTQPPLSLALMAQAEPDILELLWSNNCEALATGDDYGLTPLHIAVVRNDITQIQWLESHCQNLEKLAWQKDKRGRTPLDIASSLAYKHLAPKLGQNNAKTQPVPKSWDSDLQWLELSGEKRKELVKVIAKNDHWVDGKYKLTKNSSIKRAELAFYDPKSVRIVRLTDPTWSQGLQLFYLEAPDLKLLRLNGTSPPIHEVNASHIRLNKDNALDYLRFFCFFVRGDDGPFLISESSSQKEIPDNLTVDELSRIESFVSPARLDKFEPEKTEFLASAYVCYSNAIFFADFLIQATGMIVMENDLPLMKDLTKSVILPIA